MLGRLINRFYGTSAFGQLQIKDFLNGKMTKNGVVVEGWVHSVRKHKRAVFLDLNDGSTMRCLQVIVDPDLHKSGMTYGASVSVEGDIVETKLHRDGIEMQCKEISLICPCNENYVFNKHTKHEPQHLRSFPHLRTKEPSMVSVLQTRNALEMEIHRYFQEKGFLHIHTPILTSSDCEGAGETFAVKTDKHLEALKEDTDLEDNLYLSDPNNTKSINSIESNSEEHFFRKPVYLTVSSQLHLEACAIGVGNVYTLSPVFRAENNLTRKHLSEFRMLEVEMAFTRSLDDIMRIMEDSVKSFLQTIAQKCSLEQQYFFKDLTDDHVKSIENAAINEYLRLSYDEALKLLQRHSKRLMTYVPTWGDDFNSDHEECLMKCVNNNPVFITDFPKETKPFYMYENSDNKTVAAVDLLFPHCGELCGGSLREHRLDLLTEKLENLGIRQDYEWYLDLRRFGGIPHAGYGMGFDRLVRFALGINNIRDAVPFPRSTRSCLL